MHPSAKLELLMQIYDSGIICKCEIIEVEPDEEGKTTKVNHDETCEGMRKFRELLDKP